MRLSGIIDHIIYHNDVNSYTVLILNSGDGSDYTCVGSLPLLGAGESVTFEGEPVENPKYGTQFAVSSFTIDPIDDEASILRYLSSGAVKGVGAVLAGRIVSKFGEDSLRIIEEEPERLAEISGISMRMAINISTSFQEKSGSRQIISFLSQYDITPNLAQKIYEKYRDRVYEVIRTNPYRMTEDVEGIGFISADRIAAQMGIAKDSDHRIGAGILYVLGENISSGSMCIPEKELIQRAAELLEVDPGRVEERIDALSMDRKLIREDVEGEIYDHPERSYYTEADIARMLTELDMGSDEDEGEIAEKIGALERSTGTMLEDMQQEAVIKAVRCTLSVITGGPGTGKTTITNIIIRYFESLGYDIILAAPTGRAAKRMSEATGREAKTIHRLLGAGAVVEGRPSGGFDRDEDNPLECDVIIVDEMSMVDAFLFRSLLRAIVPGTRLILVGDVDQLPSVGPGAVLKDIIASGRFPVTRLTKIYRQSEASLIIKNAHAIIEGRDIGLDAGNEEFLFLERNEAERIIQGLIYLAGKKLPDHMQCSPLEIQVMTPMRKGVLGVQNLNRRLQEALNPPGPSKREMAVAWGILRTGDKVMQIKNNYDLEWEMPGPRGIVTETGKGIFNGDVGRVLSISSDEVYVRFDDGREAVYRGETLSELELAYAITIHKSQGSEYRAVIMPLLSGPRMLMNRNLLYTGVTRARDTVCILGSTRTVREMIANEKEEKRYTGLERRIREMGIPPA